MAMKITSDLIEKGDIPDGHVMVQFSVENNGPKETMTIRTIVPSQGTRTEQLDRATERAQKLAAQFGEFPFGRKATSVVR